ncbi:MAG: carbohydrate kinase family protein [Candidatus Gastranaerophilales bacterium]|nr:carbohydrate kinase family protein [Candidatus Gastranaerophilales bacterium]
MFDVVTFGSATIDTFVESNDAHIVSVRSIERQAELYCLPYGAKIQIDKQSFDVGGGGVNTAVCLATLGLNTATVIKIGTGANSVSVRERLKHHNISENLIVATGEEKTGFSIILTSFEGDRTVLAYRGANSDLMISDINLEELKKTKWIYCAPVSSVKDNIVEFVAEFCLKNNIKLAYNLGSKALDKTLDELASTLRAVSVLTLNVQEATKVTKIEQRYQKYKHSPINDYVKEMLKAFKVYVQDVVVITDGKKGAYAYDGEKFYYIENFPSKRVSTLGAGDCFASTFCACYIELEKSIGDSLELASINSAYVVTQYGAQSGLLTMDELMKKKEENPEYETEIVK